MENQFLFINSADRISGNENDFTVILRDIDLDKQQAAIGIQNLIIPNTYYNINSNNNLIDLGTTSLTIPEGNYTIDSFITHFNTNNGLGITASKNTLTSSIDYDSGSPFTIIPTNKQKYLGLVEGTYNDDAIDGNRHADFSGSNFFDVCCDLSMYSMNSRNQNTNILTRVYNQSLYGNFITQTYNDFCFIKLRVNDFIERPTRIWLNDENGDRVNLNSSEWSITLILNSG